MESLERIAQRIFVIRGLLSFIIAAIALRCPIPRAAPDSAGNRPQSRDV